MHEPWNGLRLESVVGGGALQCFRLLKQLCIGF